MRYKTQRLTSFGVRNISSMETRQSGSTVLTMTLHLPPTPPTTNITIDFTFLVIGILEARRRLPDLQPKTCPAAHILRDHQHFDKNRPVAFAR